MEGPPSSCGSPPAGDTELLLWLGGAASVEAVSSILCYSRRHSLALNEARLQAPWRTTTPPPPPRAAGEAEQGEAWGAAGEGGARGPRLYLAMAFPLFLVWAGHAARCQ